MKTVPLATRHSSRTQGDGRTILEKAMQKKATEMAMEKKTSKATTAKTKGITPDLSQSNSDSSKHIENIARVCGLNLGKEE